LVYDCVCDFEPLISLHCLCEQLWLCTIVGKVDSERLLKKVELVENLTDESKKLKRELNKAQASGLDLEK
jgi:hypothetical protein